MAPHLNFLATAVINAVYSVSPLIMQALASAPTSQASVETVFSVHDLLRWGKVATDALNTHYT